MYRETVEYFPTFENYSTSMQSQLDTIEKVWLTMKDKIRQELDGIRKLFNASSGSSGGNNYEDEYDVWEDDSDMDLMFYKYANDCENCS